MKPKTLLARFMAVVMLVLLVAPSVPTSAANKSTKVAERNAITALSIKKLPKDNTIQLEEGCFFNFDPEILATEQNKGKTSGLVWWEINSETNTSGVTSSRWGYVYPVYEGSFDIRALAFASASDLEAWKNARKANGNVANEEINNLYTTAVSEWETIHVVSDNPGYAVARTQYQLNLALKNKNCTDIHIATVYERSFTIQAKNYTAKKLTINAPQSEVVNSGRFAQIEIKQIKTSTFIEKAIGNLIQVTAPVARIVVDKGARISNLNLAPVPDTNHPEPKIDVIGLGGTVNQVNVSTHGTVNISADTDNSLKVGSIEVAASSNISISANISCTTTNKAVPITVRETAEDSKIETNTKSEVNTYANVEVIINHNADSLGEVGTTVVNLLKAITAVLSGTATDTVVNVSKDAVGSTVNSSTTVEINASADITIELKEGAEGSTVKKDEGVTIESGKDNTTDITIVNPDGSTDSLAPGETSTKTEETPEISEQPTTTPSTGSGSSLPSSPATPSTPTPTPTPEPTPDLEPTPSPEPTPAEDPEIDWNDAALEAAMREATGITDRAIRLSDVCDIGEFTCTDAGVQNIDALKNLVKVRRLDLRNNEISDISALAALAELQELYLGLDFGKTGNITDITALSNLENLELLHLDGQPISDINPLKELKNLRKLWLNYYSDDWSEKGNVSDASALAALTNLETLELNRQPISNINFLKELISLHEIRISTYNDDGTISDLSPLSGLTNLEILELVGQSINDISPLRELTNLREIRISTLDGSGTISDLSPLSGLHNLELLDFSGQQISDISVVANMPNLRELVLGINREGSGAISDISVLSGLNNLAGVELNGHPVSDIGALEGKNLSTLFLASPETVSGGAITLNMSVLNSMTNLNRLNLNNRRIEDLSMLKNMPLLGEASFTNTGITDAILTEDIMEALCGFSNLERIDLSNNKGITSIEPFKILKDKPIELSLWDCSISDEDFEELRKLSQGLRV